MSCKRKMRLRLGASFAFLGVFFAVPQLGHATPPPPEPGMPVAGEGLQDVRTQSIESFSVRRGLRPRVQAAQMSRQRIVNLPPGLAMVAPIVGSSVEGSVEVPIIAIQFSNTAGPPYPAANLQAELFDGPWPSGTMGDHYREMSLGKFTVSGEVLDWFRLSNTDSFYSGPLGCNGLCSNARVGDMLVSALNHADQNVDFSRFDNDGPDNLPNSGDDDGFVDFVAFVHPESGGECNDAGNDNIWSHRFSILSLTGSNYETADPGKLGSNILVDDYVIMPAFACDRTTMIEIGVFSHEFGHAFGLPDLYDTRKPVESAGIGGWGLMASGSWGGDGSTTPQTPSHMEAWSKEFLGWVSPRVVDRDQLGVQIRPVEKTGDVVRVDYTDAADPEDKKYLLLEYRAKEGFDRSIKGAGLLVTEVNNVQVQSGLVNNTVNDSALDMGINVIEADGARNLDRNQNRSDEGDVFPGSGNIASADISHVEKIAAALCNIVQTPNHITLDIFVTRTTCPGSLQPASISPSSMTRDSVAIGQEVVVKGVLYNKGSNYFTDRQLVVTGEGSAGTELPVTSPAPLEVQPGASEPSPDQKPHPNLSDLVGKKVLLRGRLQRETVKGKGLTDVFVVDEFKVAE
ncbi:M6 family metalloprotease domain-containing protein [Phyllobacterium bourgognense]|uniref:M6 family metalloprotease domain-containing protein n=1 Tax=Phyllobacterium bourgognense TaxID=314236 RepID=UPI000DF3954C|nr:M6 family metalloprotease domain-containing protein [Phyllobacterium bourgognense]